MTEEGKRRSREEIRKRRRGRRRIKGMDGLYWKQLRGQLGGKGHLVMALNSGHDVLFS